MMLPHRPGLLTGVLIGTGFVLAIVFGVGLGLALAATRNIQRMERFTEQKPALPTQILDRQGRLITEFFSDEKREMVSIDEIPRHLINALLTREDQDFYQHRGFRLHVHPRGRPGTSSPAAPSAAAAPSPSSWPATCTPTAPTSPSSARWWSCGGRIQLERALTKNEILEHYLNKMYFGHNTYGVEAASQFYFKHSVRQITLAESAMLVIQLANPGRYSPLKNPNRAQKLQQEILDQMVASATRPRRRRTSPSRTTGTPTTSPAATPPPPCSSARTGRPSSASTCASSSRSSCSARMDMYKEGLMVHTTLDLDYQRIADQVMERASCAINQQYQSQTGRRTDYGGPGRSCPSWTCWPWLSTSRTSGSPARKQRARWPHDLPGRR